MTHGLSNYAVVFMCKWYDQFFKILRPSWPLGVHGIDELDLINEWQLYYHLVT